MIEWLTTTLRFERTTPEDLGERAMRGETAIPTVVETGPGGRRRRTLEGRPFLRAQDIDQLYAAAQAAGAVSAHDPLDIDTARRPVEA
ncbi:hypothetical protein [Aurantimonas sp. Leaf443]|uniref:hypothetical protein n=1 Tax=Aurantimonas sp. Leaf443 TaxID=1736378 RepID=UPI0006F6A330|nr:hypothetical protein [Aurantimonas sp. Leaf443]KQT83992.1 hypothetical protein ASG48_11455 [Aurantimonas sp. Leaf443]